jgi:hypothetical protein
MNRNHWTRRIASLDPEREHAQIVRLLFQYEFFWDLKQALSLALFRTYAVPSIGRLLFETGQLVRETQKRYDDTALLLEAIAEHGLGSDEGRTAVRRINQMHGAYDISNDDMRYVLSTFVVVPARWIDAYGWRRLTEAERLATVKYYVELGRHMNIRGVPSTYDGFAGLMDRYEDDHFAFDTRCRQVADATLDLMATFAPFHRVPRTLARRAAFAFMDRRLREALGYPDPVEGAIYRSALKVRSRLMRLMPAPDRPTLMRHPSHTRTYPRGFEIAELGTFPRACPVRRDH